MFRSRAQDSFVVRHERCNGNYAAHTPVNPASTEVQDGAKGSVTTPAVRSEPRYHSTEQDNVCISHDELYKTVNSLEAIAIVYASSSDSEEEC
jgi:hypothetical protein